MSDIWTQLSPPFGRIFLILLIAGAFAFLANVTYDFGALLHEIFCPTHGMAFS